MRRKNIRDNLLDSEATLKDVMTALNKGVFGIVFIADDEGRVEGIFTDGDVRRAILIKDASLDSKATNYMKRDFIFAGVEESRDGILKKMTGNIRHLPVLDEQRRLIDFVSWAELWRQPIMEPKLGGNELKYVSDCITSNWISSQGGYVKKFEKEFAEYHDTDYALTTSNGTSALHLALLAAGIGEGDEVVVPDSTFIASANAVRHAGATPVFVDVSPTHWTLDVNKVEEKISSKTKAIMPVHLYGHPCEMDPILKMAKKYSLYVIEDCAESLGASYLGRLTGTMGDIGCFSFFSNKVITTGEGGMVITRSKKLHDKMALLRDHGMSKNKRYWHECIGYNYRMTNLQAAVGLAQMEQIDGFLEKRLAIARWYDDRLSDIAGLTLPVTMEWAKNIYWLYTILIDRHIVGLSRDDLIDQLDDEGVETRPFFFPIHKQPPYARFRGEFPVAEQLSISGISLPSGNGLFEQDVERVCQILKSILESSKRNRNENG